MHKDAGKENKYFSVHTIGRDNPEKIEKKFKLRATTAYLQSYTCYSGAVVAELCKRLVQKSETVFLCAAIVKCRSKKQKYSKIFFLLWST